MGRRAPRWVSVSATLSRVVHIDGRIPPKHCFVVAKVLVHLPNVWKCIGDVHRPLPDVSDRSGELNRDFGKCVNISADLPKKLFGSRRAYKQFKNSLEAGACKTSCIFIFLLRAAIDFGFFSSQSMIILHCLKIARTLCTLVLGIYFFSGCQRLFSEIASTFFAEKKYSKHRLAQRSTYF